MFSFSPKPKGNGGFLRDDGLVFVGLMDIGIETQELMSQWEVGSGANCRIAMTDMTG